MTEITIRPATTIDLDPIKRIAVDVEMFTVDEVDFFDEMLRGSLDRSLPGHRWLVAESADGVVVGAAQFAPEPFADRMWNLYFIAVDQDHQGAGIGHELMACVERDLTGRGPTEARTLIVETSSTDGYRNARRFYAGLGYDEDARVRDFYGPDDHKVVFWKALNRSGASMR